MLYPQPNNRKPDQKPLFQTPGGIFIIGTLALTVVFGAAKVVGFINEVANELEVSDSQGFLLPFDSPNLLDKGKDGLNLRSVPDPKSAPDGDAGSNQLAPRSQDSNQKGSPTAINKGTWSLVQVVRGENSKESSSRINAGSFVMQFNQDHSGKFFNQNQSQVFDFTWTMTPDGEITVQLFSLQEGKKATFVGEIQDGETLYLKNTSKTGDIQTLVFN